MLRYLVLCPEGVPPSILRTTTRLLLLIILCLHVYSQGPGDWLTTLINSLTINRKSGMLNCFCVVSMRTMYQFVPLLFPSADLDRTLRQPSHKTEQSQPESGGVCELPTPEPHRSSDGGHLDRSQGRSSHLLRPTRCPEGESGHGL